MTEQELRVFYPRLMKAAGVEDEIGEREMDGLVGDFMQGGRKVLTRADF